MFNHPVQGDWTLSQQSWGERQEYTHTQIQTEKLTPVQFGVWGMSLDWGRKLEHLEKTSTDMRKTHKVLLTKSKSS